MPDDSFTARHEIATLAAEMPGRLAAEAPPPASSSCSLRVQIRLPTSNRPSLLRVPTDATLGEFKAMAAAKLGVAGCAAVLLGSGVPARLPHVDSLSDLDQDDVVTILPIGAAAAEESLTEETKEAVEAQRQAWRAPAFGVGDAAGDRCAECGSTFHFHGECKAVPERCTQCGSTNLTIHDMGGHGEFECQRCKRWGAF
jgi:hypothetical protein